MKCDIYQTRDNHRTNICELVNYCIGKCTDEGDITGIYALCI